MSLCTLYPEIEPFDSGMLIVPERAGVARVRLLVEFLAEQIAAIPGIEKSLSEH